MALKAVAPSAPERTLHIISIAQVVEVVVDEVAGAIVTEEEAISLVGEEIQVLRIHSWIMFLPLIL